MNPFNIAARLSAEAKRLAMLNGDFDSDDDDDDDGMDGVASTGAGGKRTIDEVYEHTTDLNCAPTRRIRLSGGNSTSSTGR